MKKPNHSESNPTPQPRIPFVVGEKNGLQWKVKVEGDGRSGTRYYFVHPKLWVVSPKTGKKRRAKIHNTSKEVIEATLKAILRDMENGTVSLTQDQYNALRQTEGRFDLLVRELEGTNLSPEGFLHQALPVLRQVQADGVTLSELVVAGKSYYRIL